MPSQKFRLTPERWQEWQSHIIRLQLRSWSKIFECGVTSESIDDLVESSQSQVTRTVESLRVIGLQARVKRNFTFFLCLFFLWK